MPNQCFLWVKDEVRGRDKLIAWAYRYMQNHCAVTTCDDGSRLYPSSVLEFFKASHEVVPDVAELAETVDAEADFAIKLRKRRPALTVIDGGPQEGP